MSDSGGGGGGGAERGREGRCAVAESVRCKKMNGGWRSASSKKGARETDVETAGAIVARVGLGHEQAEGSTEITGSRAVRYGSEGFCVFEKPVARESHLQKPQPVGDVLATRRIFFCLDQPSTEKVY
jgi:hypothetical protein